MIKDLRFFLILFALAFLNGCASEPMTPEEERDQSERMARAGQILLNGSRQMAPRQPSQMQMIGPQEKREKCRVINYGAGVTTTQCEPDL